MLFLRDIVPLLYEKQQGRPSDLGRMHPIEMARAVAPVGCRYRENWPMRTRYSCNKFWFGGFLKKENSDLEVPIVVLYFSPPMRTVHLNISAKLSQKDATIDPLSARESRACESETLPAPAVSCACLTLNCPFSSPGHPDYLMHEPD
jgi:hypothetical protein